MKRLFFYVLTCICTTAVMATDGLVVKDVNIAPGGIGKMNIELANAKPYSAFQFDLTLPSGITIAKDGENLKAALNSSRISDHQLHVAEISPGTYRFLGYSLTNASITGESGVLVTVTVNAANDVEEGSLTATTAEGLIVTAESEQLVPDDDEASVNVTGAEKITINKYGQLAYSTDKALDFSTLEDVKAFVATGYDKTKGVIWLTRVKKVPANTGFLLQGAGGDYSIPVIADGSEYYYANLFEATLTGTTVKPTQDGKAIYYLTTDKDKDGNTIIGFYRAKDNDGKGTKIGANRAYLAVPADIPAVGEAGSTEAITVNKYGQVAYYSANSLDFTSLAEQGVKAYTATGYDYKKGTIYLTNVKQIPAQTGFLIMAPQGTYDVPMASVASVYGNMFVGNLDATTIYKDATVAGQSYMNYYLTTDKDKNGNTIIGFYRAKEDGTGIGKNRSYLQVPALAGASARALARGIGGGEVLPGSVEESEIIAIRLLGDADRSATGIDSVERVYEKDVYYNLQGQRVDRPGKGLYIKNGKKVVIK